MAAEWTIPNELRHAKRHLDAAEIEMTSGHRTMALMHLREALTDTAWVLYQVAADDDAPRNDTAG